MRTTFWDENTPLQESSDNGQVIARYEFAGSQATGLIHAEDGQQNLHADALGSIVLTTDTSGAIHRETLFDPWGNPLTESGTPANRLGYTGHIMDAETGLIYMQARYYDPEAGRFISMDPAAGKPDTPASYHRYLYAYGNPAVYIDPTGQMAEIEKFRDGLRDTSADLGENANATTGAGDLLWNIAQRASLEVLALGASAVNVFADATVLAGKKTGYWDEQRVSESSQSIAKSTEAGIKAYDYFANQDGLAKIYDAAVDNTARWMEGDRQAASNMGTFFAGFLGVGGVAKPVTNARGLASAVEKELLAVGTEGTATLDQVLEETASATVIKQTGRLTVEGDGLAVKTVASTTSRSVPAKMSEVATHSRVADEAAALRRIAENNATPEAKALHEGINARAQPDEQDFARATRERVLAEARAVPRQTTILGENMERRVMPFAENTNTRTLGFGATPEEWAAMSPTQRWKLNDGMLRARINQGDAFRYIGRDPKRWLTNRQRFDLTGSELLRLEGRAVPYEIVSPEEVFEAIGRR
jgi:RHS repeat-associated protein